jgi:hypothetical protein
VIIVIHGSPRRLFGYWQKPVTGRPGRYRQNHRFIVVTGTQRWLVLSSGNHGNWLQGENFNVLPDLHTTRIFQIPIVSRHTEIPGLRPAVSSLGACPTPAP